MTSEIPEALPQHLINLSQANWDIFRGGKTNNSQVDRISPERFMIQTWGIVTQEYSYFDFDHFDWSAVVDVNTTGLRYGESVTTFLPRLGIFEPNNGNHRYGIRKVSRTLQYELIDHLYPEDEDKSIRCFAETCKRFPTAMNNAVYFLEDSGNFILTLLRLREAGLPLARYTLIRSIPFVDQIIEIGVGGGFAVQRGSDIFPGDKCTRLRFYTPRNRLT